jgi:hypothetical protein
VANNIISAMGINRFILLNVYLPYLTASFGKSFGVRLYIRKKADANHFNLRIG